jgi:hypothetical protein
MIRPSRPKPTGFSPKKKKQEEKKNIKMIENAISQQILIRY